MDEQPRLSTPVPAAAPAGAFAGADFDRDGVINRADNCLLVPNPDQRRATRPAGATVDPLAAEWKNANPRAAFRTNAEVGEACSGWNENWRRTEEAQLLAPEPLKQQLFRYLGEGGPILGHVIRGNSYVDGRPVAIMDWRRSTGAGVNGWPVANPDVPGFGSFLVYDECRGLQEGIWTCNANADIVKPGGDRRLCQFGWMMWQTLGPDIARWEAWERASPQWTRPEAYVPALSRFG